ncbi:MAG: DUF5698 domain-containing protein [bacterium]
MNFNSLFDSNLFAFVLLPILIFLARIGDVTVGTIRVIFVTRGFRWYSTLLAFIEVMIWLMAIGQIMRNLNSASCYIAYACGYATGTFVGVWLEAKLSLGQVVIRVITQKDTSALIEYLRAAKCAVTSVDAEVTGEKAKIVFSVINRQDLGRVVEQIKKFNPNAFYSVQDVRMVSEGGIAPQRSPWAGATSLPGGMR